jgi:hypothetical protein
MGCAHDSPLSTGEIISSYDDPRGGVCAVCGSTSFSYAIS